MMLGVKIAQVAQSYGADDIDGTVVHEKIYHDAGSRSAAGIDRGGTPPPDRGSRPRAGRTRYALSRSGSRTTDVARVNLATTRWIKLAWFHDIICASRS